MNDIDKEKIRKALSEMFDDGYRLGAAAENEACAKVVETECCKCADAAAAIRERMK